MCLVTFYSFKIHCCVMSLTRVPAPLHFLLVCLFFVASLKQVHRCRCITQYCGNRPRNSLWHIARLINFIPLQLQQNIKGDKTLIQSTTSWTQETDVARTLTRADQGVMSKPSVSVFTVIVQFCGIALSSQFV